jgi:hypothetical protein
MSRGSTTKVKNFSKIINSEILNPLTLYSVGYIFKHQLGDRLYFTRVILIFLGLVKETDQTFKMGHASSRLYKFISQNNIRINAY